MQNLLRGVVQKKKIPQWPFKVSVGVCAKSSVVCVFIYRLYLLWKFKIKLEKEMMQHFYLQGQTKNLQDKTLHDKVFGWNIEQICLVSSNSVFLVTNGNQAHNAQQQDNIKSSHISDPRFQQCMFINVLISIQLKHSWKCSANNKTHIKKTHHRTRGYIDMLLCFGLFVLSVQ